MVPLGFDPMESILTIADEEDRPLKRVVLRDVLAAH